MAVNSDGARKEPPNQSSIDLSTLLPTPGGGHAACQVFGAEKVSKARWETARKSVRNRTRKQVVLAFDKWSRDEKRLFWKICGPIMDWLGYVR